MSIRDSRLLAALCLVATVSSYGCDSDNGLKEERADRIGPSPISFNGLGEPITNSTDFFARGVTLQPAIVTPQLVPSAACPTRASFVAPIKVVAVAGGDSDLFLNQVDARFVDRKGAFRNSITFAHPQLVEIFGSTSIPRLAGRTFPFTFPFGCTGEFTGTLTVTVLTGDSIGRRGSRSFSVDVR